MNTRYVPPLMFCIRIASAGQRDCSWNRSIQLHFIWACANKGSDFATLRLGFLERPKSATRGIEQVAVRRGSEQGARGAERDNRRLRYTPNQCNIYIYIHTYTHPYTDRYIYFYLHLYMYMHVDCQTTTSPGMPSLKEALRQLPRAS